MQLVRGRVSIRLEREDGTVIEKDDHNVLCYLALERMSQFLVDGNTGLIGPISYLKIGSGTSYFEDKSKQIDVIREEFKADLYGKAYLEEDVDGKLVEVQEDKRTRFASYRFKIEMYDPSSNISVTEMGLFTSDGTMFAYKVFDEPLEKRINDRLFVDWVIILHTVTGVVFEHTEFTYDEFWKMRKVSTIDLKLTKATKRGPELKWTPPSIVGVAAYNIYRREYGSSEPQLIETLKTEIGPHKSLYLKPDTYVDTTVIWGKLYYYSVRILNVSGVESDYSAEVAFPAIRLTASIGKQRIELFWDHISDWEELVGYIIYLRKPGDVYISVARLPEITLSVPIKNYYTVKSIGGQTLENGKPYMFVVAAIDSSETEYIKSYPVVVTPTEHFPSAPHISHAESGDSRADLIWQSADEAVSYNLYEIDHGSQTSNLSSISGLAYSFLSAIADFRSISGMIRFTIESLENQHLYEFVLKAVNKDGSESVFSNSVSAIPRPKILDAPKQIGVTERNMEIILDWQPVSEAKLYMVHWYYRGEWLLMGETAINRFVAENLQNGVTYMFRISAVDYKGQRGFESQSVFGTPTDTIAPYLPQDLVYSIESVDDINKLIHMSWSANQEPDLDHYNVYGAGGSLGAFGKITDIEVNQFSYMGQVGNVYSFSVTSVDKNGNESGYSNEIRIVL